MSAARGEQTNCERAGNFHTGAVGAPVRTVSAGLHSFLRISRQIAPLSLLMFGCQTRVSNFICQAAEGSGVRRKRVQLVKRTFGGTNG